MTNNESDKRHLRQEKHRTAADFLDVLSMRHSSWEGEGSSWIFRGHARAEWHLVPKAARDDWCGGFAELGIKVEPSAQAQYWLTRQGALNKLLREFRNRLDRSGLAIPSPLPPIDHHDLPDGHISGEPPEESLPLVALAQHHGLPTTFLDWTRRSLVAAYFAAAGTAGESKKSPTDDNADLAVWCLQRGSQSTLYWQGEDDDVVYLRFYEAPCAMNPNLRAQSGLFTYLFATDHLDLEKHLVRRKESGATPGLPLRCLTLPRSEAATLLRLLADEGIDGASMFPGPHGVVQAMRERSLWDKPPGR